jgi:hypothetical protein
MKKLTITLILLTIIQFTNAEGNPPLTIEYKYKSTSDTTYCSSLKSDNNFCCNFIITSTPSETNDNMMIIKHTKTGVVLGTFYGKPSKIFIMEVCNKQGYLDTTKVDKIVQKMLGVN